jgi:hypothetical protein
VYRDLVLAAVALPTLEILVPQDRQLGEGARFNRPFALYVSRIDDQKYLVRFDHGANLELAPKMAAAFAADAEELYHVPDMRELAHFISPSLLTNHPAERRHEPNIPVYAGAWVGPQSRAARRLGQYSQY